VIIQDEGCFSRSANVEVCEGPRGLTVGKRIPSVTRIKDSLNPGCNERSAVGGRKCYNNKMMAISGLPE
jgi:hypothetical protein